MSETIGLILLIVGITFDVVGCVGLVRLPDIYNRLQAATKCVTLGTCMILLSVIFYTGIGRVYSSRAFAQDLVAFKVGGGIVEARSDCQTTYNQQGQNDRQSLPFLAAYHFS